MLKNNSIYKSPKTKIYFRFRYFIDKKRRKNKTVKTKTTTKLTIIIINKTRYFVKISNQALKTTIKNML